ncbi:flagellar hook-basal body complex protein FliE [Metabacillus litoralis]|jgi:flagellar hook-basal body complex protein FliE|uniref:flagellar hook-basal body complex protein FliE n=1 Tax=Metabacillus litoralis TaxID=152268 RepID=UPI00203FFF21|nr:flagellar hook-basal body complex protein FliE [Metabacillus litoralis]MCM3652647.1 flagellar hook-basal body complex protein FliE [Metabacillus litoralis]
MINSVTPFRLSPTAQNQIDLKPNLSMNDTKTKMNFSETLKQAIEQVNQSQIESDNMTEALATGKNVELHDVMITAQKASVTMSLAIEVRNKAIEAYQEMMRMQV